MKPETKLPPRYADALASFATREVQFGLGGLLLFSLEEMDEGQVGYSVGLDGGSLCTGEPGAWRQSWIVIAYETGCGDPVFLDTSDSRLPVLTATHGVGKWEPRQMAVSIEAFVRSFNAFAQIAEGRTSPVQLEANPLEETDRALFLNRIREWNGGAVDPVEQWHLLLEF